MPALRTQRPADALELDAPALLRLRRASPDRLRLLHAVRLRTPGAAALRPSLAHGCYGGAGSLRAMAPLAQGLLFRARAVRARSDRGRGAGRHWLLPPGSSEPLSGGRRITAHAALSFSPGESESSMVARLHKDGGQSEIPSSHRHVAGVLSTSAVKPGRSCKTPNQGERTLFMPLRLPAVTLRKPRGRQGASAPKRAAKAHAGERLPESLEQRAGLPVLEPRASPLHSLPTRSCTACVDRKSRRSVARGFPRSCHGPSLRAASHEEPASRDYGADPAAAALSPR